MTPLGPPLMSPEPEARIRGELCTSGSIFKCHESGIEAIVVYPCIDKYSWKGRVKFKVLTFQTVLFQDKVAQEDLSCGPSPSLPTFPLGGILSVNLSTAQPSWHIPTSSICPSLHYKEHPLASGLGEDLGPHEA